MNPHSELETKWSANLIGPDDVAQALGGEDVDSYKRVGGPDRYYKQGKNFLRHRCDGKRKTSVLTVKSRKSLDSIQDRNEVDMPIADYVPEADVTAFLLATGWELYFQIEKMSYIWRVINPTYTAVIALYDVFKLGPDGFTDRYLEVEIEKDSVCTDTEGKTFLEAWNKKLEWRLDIGKPLNTSLLEMYGPKPLLTKEVLDKLSTSDDLVAAMIKEKE